MPVPGFVARINRRIFNPRELKKGHRPVLVHKGRSTGVERRTPLDAHRVDGGYVFILMYGSGSDWVQNILAEGTAMLEVNRESIQLDSPRVVTESDTWQVPSSITKPPGFLNVTEYLVMDLAADSDTHSSEETIQG